MSMPPLQHWSALHGQPAAPLLGGLINDTWRVGDPPLAVVQRLNPIFDASVHLDIEAITAHIAAKGMPTPRLLRTDAGALWHSDDSGCWRALSWVPGQSFHKLSSPVQAAEAGALVGRWHWATRDLEHEFHFSRPLAHDTEHHMAVLRQALSEHPSHRLREQVAPLAEQVLAAWDRWEGRLDLPKRVCHGDLKISNLRFSETGEAICLLDLDTMGLLPLDVELGDAWRSWCNPATEDQDEAVFDLRLFAASARAYLTENPQPDDILQALPPGVERICLELTARFAADALNESYFGWDPAAAPTRGEHNLLRARGQFSLARAVKLVQGEMQGLLRRC